MDHITFSEKIKELVKIKHPKLHTGDANPKITVIHAKRPCEDCDRMVKGRVVEYYIKLWTKNPEWTKECSVCKLKESRKKSLQPKLKDL